MYNVLHLLLHSTPLDSINSHYIVFQHDATSLLDKTKIDAKHKNANTPKTSFLFCYVKMEKAFILTCKQKRKGVLD